MALVRKKNLLFFISFSLFAVAWSQPISISAGRMKGYKKDGKEFQHLEGNVRFEQNGNTVSCDVADYNSEEEELTGTGNVVIVSAEGVRITGSTLVFNNKDKLATVSG